MNKLRLYHSGKSYDVTSKDALRRRRDLIKDLGYNVTVFDLWSVPCVHNSVSSDSETTLAGLTQPDPVRQVHCTGGRESSLEEDDVFVDQLLQMTSTSCAKTATTMPKKRVASSQPLVKRRKNSNGRRQTSIGEYLSQN